MKRIKTYLIMSIMLLAAAGVLRTDAQAAATVITYTPEGANYTLSFEVASGAEKAVLTGFAETPEGDVTRLEIPAEVEGHPVSAVGHSAFSGCTALTGTVVFPEGLQKIDQYAFRFCSGLTGPLNLPDSVTSVESYAFEGCSGLTSLSLPDNLKTIGYSAFHSCSGFTGDLLIPDSVTEIGSSAFSGCGFTGTLTLPNAVTAIQIYTFYNCTGFTGHLTIPDGVTEIGYSAFENCAGFTGLTLPASLKTFDTFSQYGSCAFENCSGLTGTLVIPEGVTCIENGAFSGCSGLTAVEFPEGLETIGSAAFRKCSGLESIEFPDNLQVIGGGAFAYCTGLTEELVLPEALESLGNGAFRECTSLPGSLTIPQNILTIGEFTFLDCGFTGTLTLPKNLQSIGLSAFENCGFTGKLTLPETLTQVGKEAFTGCSFTGDLVIPDTLSSLAESAFYNSGFTGDLIFGSLPESIPASAFKDCGFTGKLTLPKKLTEIGKEAFSGCPFTGDLDIPDSVTAIGNSAFYGCSGLTGSLVIPEGVESISTSAFSNCGFTGTLTLPETLTSIENGAFEQCGFTGTLTLPEALTSIGSRAFEQCSFTGRLYLPEGLTSIGSYAFKNCSGFTGRLTLPQELVSIPEGTFQYCSGFTGLTLSPATRGIGQYAFAHCTGLTGSLVIPYSVTFIGHQAFYFCSSIQVLYVPTNMPFDEYYGDSFVGCHGVMDVYYGGNESEWSALELYRQLDSRCIIHYESYKDKGLEITGDAYSVNLGDTVTLQAAWGATTYAYSRDFSWSVSDPSVLQLVDSSCTLGSGGFSASLTATFRALKEGEVTVTAYGPGNTSDTCGVTSVCSRTITYMSHPDQAADKPLFLKAGETKTLSFSYQSSGDLAAEMEEIQWEVEGDAAESISLANIQAEITGTNAVLLTASVTALSSGDPVTIRVSGPGDCADTCQVQVLDTVITILEHKTAAPVEEIHRFRLTVGETLELYVRYETGLDEESAAESVKKWKWSMCTEDFLADPEMVAETKTLAFRYTETALPIELTCSKQSDGVYLVKATFVPAMEGVTSLKVENEDGAEDLCLIYATFDIPQYRASIQQEGENLAVEQLDSYLDGDTPATLLIKSLNETNGFKNAAQTWEQLEIIFQGLDNPADLGNIRVEEEDIYYALLWDLFANAQKNNLDFHCQTLTTFCKNVSSSTEDIASLVYKASLSNKDDFSTWLADAEKSLFLQSHKENSYLEKFKGFDSSSKYLIGLDFLMLGLDGYNDYQLATTNAAIVSAVTSDMERVLEAMLAECPQSNPALYSALEKFLTHAQASKEEALEMLRSGSMTATGVKGAQMLNDVVWDMLEDKVKKTIPEVALLHLAYKTSSTFCKFAYNTDDTLEEHHKMLALQQIKAVARDASQTLGVVWEKDPSTQTAKEYLASIEVLNAIHDTDCQLALNYVDAVDKAWETPLESSWNEIFGEGKFSGAVSAFEDYRADLNSAFNDWRATWIPNSAVDYPGTLLSLIYSDEYTAITGKPPIRVIRAACPVDVYVRNAAGEVVAFAEGGNISSCADDVAVMLEGDVKTIALYGTPNFAFDFEGTGTGTMDLTDTLLASDGSEIRTVQYYDLPLADGTSYSYTETENLVKGSTSVRPGGDSQSSTTYTISVVSGFMDQLGDTPTTAKAYAGQLITVSACIPEGCVFAGWTSTLGTDLFEDPDQPVTTFQMPAGNVTVTAQYKKTSGQLEVTDEAGNTLNEIPKGRFILRAPAPDSEARGLLAGYSTSGQMVFAAESAASAEDSGTHTAIVDNTNGEIVQLKFFWLTEELVPLQEVSVFPKAG